MIARKPIGCFLFLALIPVPFLAQSVLPPPGPVFGYADFSKQARIEEKFLAVPSAKLAGLHLKTLTAEPHLASTAQDHKIAEYIALKFRQAGLETEIVPYRVLLNQPKKIRLEVYDAAGHLLLSGPTREHVEGDPFQDNPRAMMPFHGSSGSGDVTAEVVYANYGRREDFDQLAARHIDLHGKIVLARYGVNFRGVKVYLAEQRGAAAVLLYSDPHDDGYSKGDTYPDGPWGPETAVQRGSVQYLFKYPGDPETPGVASTLALPDSARIPANTSGNQPLIPSIPISYHDAAPILKGLKGPVTPLGWQGALPFRYHLGPGGVKVHVISEQDYQRRVIWDVIGRIKGTEHPNEWVIAGNHHDAWVYGAADPSSGTAAMLESVHGIGALLKQGWHPKRTMIFASWDAEEEGLIGSTEWVEQHGQVLENAVAYFNMDVGVSGPEFNASAVPSLSQFLRELTRSVPSPLGASVYRQWVISQATRGERKEDSTPDEDETHLGDLGSGSDFTAFFEHAGVPATNIGSEGPYGVYHSVFDNYAWFTQNADPHFLYVQQMARVFGLEALRMADVDVLPYDYVTYARDIDSSIAAAKKKALSADGKSSSPGDPELASVDFGPAQAAAARFIAAAEKVHRLQIAPSGDLDNLNLALRRTETALLSDGGLPNRPWYRHTIYAPGEFTGYAAVVIPGVNEAIDARDASRAAQQLAVLAQALDRAAQTLDAGR
ncbi:MAG: M28 family metallopeptidase [Terracidiphilus sp.]|nr:M28 family metallopeptidase [Terracidiphilus sp.]MDR3776244.1 M28 family metallopeptidase [Terracidiphilus sp.]